MKFSELREMSDEQLVATLTEAKQTLFRLRIRAQTERLDVPSEVRKSRRLIARVKTLQTQREGARVGAAAHAAIAMHAEMPRQLETGKST